MSRSAPRSVLATATTAAVAIAVVAGMVLLSHGRGAPAYAAAAFAHSSSAKPSPSCSPTADDCGEPPLPKKPVKVAIMAPKHAKSGQQVTADITYTDGAKGTLTTTVTGPKHYRHVWHNKTTLTFSVVQGTYKIVARFAPANGYARAAAQHTVSVRSHSKG